MDLTAVDACVDLAPETQPIAPAPSTQPITPSTQPKDSEQQHEGNAQSPLSGQTLSPPFYPSMDEMFRSANSPSGLEEDWGGESRDAECLCA